MLRTALRNLRHHVVRLLLSGVAIVLGVAFVVGTLIFTDTLHRTFSDLFEGTTSDVVVTAVQSVETGNMAGAVATFPASLLDTVRNVPEVAAADGLVLVDGVTVVGPDGKAVGLAGAPQFGASWSDDPALDSLRLTEGRGPSQPGEVALDSVAADKTGAQIGGAVSFVGPDGPFTAELVGVFRYGTSGNLAGATISAFTTDYAQELLLGGAHAYTEIDAMAVDGTSEEQLAAAVRSAVGADIEVRTGQQMVDDTTAEFTEALGFINVFLLVFAGIALFVGTFIILNTFSMLVAQRSRELALLRALGGTRAQVIRSMIVESTLVGLVGSVVGVLVGVGVASALQALFGAIGMDIPTNGMVISARTVIVGIVLGTIVTVVAALAPSVRAARIPPMAALREDAIPRARSLRLRAIVGSLLLAAGSGAMLFGSVLAEEPSTATVGIGTLTALVGVITLSPVLASPVVRILGAPFPRLFGTSGRLAVDNAQRQPRRTAATASALMIGLALVSTLTIVAASAKASVDHAVDRVLGADLLVTTETQRPFPHRVALDTADVPGVASVSAVSLVPAEIGGQPTALVAIDPSTIGAMLDVPTIPGGLDVLSASGGLAIDATMAANLGLKVGTDADVTLPTGSVTMPVVALYPADGNFSGAVVAQDTISDNGVSMGDAQVFVKVDSGSDVAPIEAAIKERLADYPTITVQNRAEYKQQVISNVDQLLIVMVMLLSLAVLIAVLGIVNTLALSVIERTREIGMLRALGALRRQVRWMVMLEALAIASYGAVIGLVLGVGFATALQRTLVTQGIDTLAIPWTSLLVFFVLSAIIGVLAAVGPAFRAGRLNMLEAITTE